MMHIENESQAGAIQQSSLNIVLPGEKIDLSGINGQLQVDNKGFHVQSSDNTVSSKRGGVLVQTQMGEGTDQNNSTVGLGLQGEFRKYYAEADDYVIGIVKGRMQETYIVDIGAEEDALLSFSAFEGATKKNRPNLRDGSVVFCRIDEVSRYLKVKVDCIHPKNKKQWMTGESFFGQLKEGTIAAIPIVYAKEIIAGGDYVFKAFRKYISQFETSVGANGIVWVKTHQPKNTIMIIKALQECQFMTQEQIKDYVQKLSVFLVKE